MKDAQTPLSAARLGVVFSTPNLATPVRSLTVPQDLSPEPGLAPEEATE
jgi:hypothetical protein